MQGKFKNSFGVFLRILWYSGSLSKHGRSAYDRCEASAGREGRAGPQALLRDHSRLFCPGRELLQALLGVFYRLLPGGDHRNPVHAPHPWGAPEPQRTHLRAVLSGVGPGRGAVYRVLPPPHRAAGPGDLSGGHGARRGLRIPVLLGPGGAVRSLLLGLQPPALSTPCSGGWPPCSG